MNVKKYAWSPAPHWLDTDYRARREWIKFAALLPVFLVLLIHDPVETVLKTAVSFAAVWILKTAFFLSKKKREKGDTAAAFLTPLLLAVLLPEKAPILLLFLSAAGGVFLTQAAWGGAAFAPAHPALVSYCLLKVLSGSQAPEFTSWVFRFWNPFTDFWHALVCSVLLASGFILMFQKVISWKLPAIYCGMIFALSFGMGLHSSLPLAGILLAAFYFAAHSSAAPIAEKGKFVFAVLAALGAIILDLLGAPADFAFALLLASFVTPWLDQWIVPAGVRS